MTGSMEGSVGGDNEVALIPEFRLSSLAVRLGPTISHAHYTPVAPGEDA